jgi:hypothetical protein
MEANGLGTKLEEGTNFEESMVGHGAYPWSSFWKGEAISLAFSFPFLPFPLPFPLFLGIGFC